MKVQKVEHYSHSWVMVDGECYYRYDATTWKHADGVYKFLNPNRVRELENAYQEYLNEQK